MVTQDLARFRQATGTRPNLSVRYVTWGHPLPMGRIASLEAQQVMPLVEIEPRGLSLTSIAAGAHDTYLRQVARQARAARGKIALSFAPEMDGHWYSWGAHPAAFRAAWRHVVSVIRQGARNVTWVWIVSAGSTSPAKDRLYWPGSAYVTWVGLDGYYYRPSRTFAQIFAPAITAVRKLTDAPVLLSETAIGPVAGQAQMIPNLFEGIDRYHLLGLVWFDISQHAGLYHQDWRLEGHAAAIAEFREGVARMLRGTS